MKDKLEQIQQAIEGIERQNFIPFPRGKKTERVKHWLYLPKTLADRIDEHMRLVGPHRSRGQFIIDACTRLLRDETHKIILARKLSEASSENDKG